MKARSWKELGVGIPQVYLPSNRDLAKWCVIACDQYTSDMAYWENVERQVGGAPSTLHMVLPEAYLGTGRERGREQSAVAAMENYMADNTLEQQLPGFILVKRTFLNPETGEAKPEKRTGLMVSLDLEQYDYNHGAAALIRASEGTIEERLPARMGIRRNAQLELPHIMVLIDDRQRSVIEPLAAMTGELQQVYGSELGFGMGSIEGWLVPEAKAEKARAALSSLLGRLKARPEFGPPMLYAMGDGNHSFAAAKACWEELKPTLPESEQQNHPARYALCELVNVHDEGLRFEAIHRVVLNCGGRDGLDRLVEAFGGMGAQAVLSPEPLGEGQCLRYVAGDEYGCVNIKFAPHPLEAGSIDMAIERLLAETPGAEVDYVHGDGEATALGMQAGNFSLLPPAIGKEQLFEYVEMNGPLPRKAFSMGSADEKRCYLEARRIK